MSLWRVQAPRPGVLVPPRLLDRDLLVHGRLCSIYRLIDEDPRGVHRLPGIGPVLVVLAQGLVLPGCDFKLPQRGTRFPNALACRRRATDGELRFELCQLVIGRPVRRGWKRAEDGVRPLYVQPPRFQRAADFVVEREEPRMVTLRLRHSSRMSAVECPVHDGHDDPERSHDDDGPSGVHGIGG